MNTKTNTPLPSEGSVVGSVENQDRQLKLPLLGSTVSVGVVPRWMDLKGYMRRWRASHKEKCREYSNRKYAKHREKIIAHRKSPEVWKRHQEWQKAYREKNRKHLDDLMRKWNKTHKEHRQEYRRKYAPRRRELYRLNRERILARKREIAPRYRFRVQDYCHRKRRTDIQYALKDRLRATMNRALRRQWVEKSMRTMELIGCTVEEVKAHIASQFVNGMAWENKGTWHVDHIVPLSAFDLRDVEEQKVAFNWMNLQPLPGHENHRKSDKLPDPLPDWLPAWMVERLQQRKTAQALA